MSDQPGRNQSATWPGSSSSLFAKFRHRLRSPQVPAQSASVAQQSTTSPIPHSLQMEPLLPPSVSSSHTSSAITLMVTPKTRVQQMEAVRSVVYGGSKTVLQTIHDFSDMLPPLKTAAAVFLKIIEIVDTVSGNRKELEDLKAKLKTIILIVKKYQENSCLPVIEHRIKEFLEAINLWLEEVKKMQDHSLLARVAEGTKDADTIVKAFRNISSLCDRFQIDTQLNIEKMTDNILQRLKSDCINKLNHEMTSYKTRHSSYNDTGGCLEGTRVKILEDLETWASDDKSSKVYWMVGMAGTGKSTILHSLCEMLDRTNTLGGSFFGSRASDKTNDARLIVPVIAHALARASPSIKCEVVRAIEEDPDLAEPTYNKLDEQFKKLIYDPIRRRASTVVGTYKIIVIDAVDECVDLRVVSSLIKLILSLVSDIPLKFFIASRDETLIRNAFSSKPDVRNLFYLHEVEKDIVKHDIEMYITKSLARIQGERYVVCASDVWPSREQLSMLVDLSDRLFIYAATAIRFIDDEGYQGRLSLMISSKSESSENLPTARIDDLYGQIIERACGQKTHDEVSAIMQTLTAIIFLRNPLPIQAITSLLQMDISVPLSRLKSLIYVPTDKEAPVAPFHASFPDFVTTLTRCSPKRCPSFSALVPSEGHTMLALNCLAFMNRSLKYNICGVPERLTVSCKDATNLRYDTSDISEALKYSCVYWASHLAEVRVLATDLINALRIFLHTHLLHWMECLSLLGELQTGVKSLENATTVLSHFQKTDDQCHDLQLLVVDARRCLRTNFECIQQHCFEIYQSALVWIPKNSLIRNFYATYVSRVPKLILGLSESWGPTEIVIQNRSVVQSVAFSPDGSQVVSGSADGRARIWLTTTGELQTELKGHADKVTSVAFSQDGNQVITGSIDSTIRISNTTTGEVRAELKGHTDNVTSVAFSQDGSRVVSGSYDDTIRIWDTTTGEVQAELKGHTGWVKSVAFSQNGTRVVSGSDDTTVRIWNAITGEVQVELKGHTDEVRSVAFSQDGSQVVSGSKDTTVWIWNAITGEMQAELKGHRDEVRSVAFSPEGNRVVCGSCDTTILIWSTITYDIEAKLSGHTDVVTSVAFSQDGSQVVSGSYDNTIRIWNAIRSEMAELNAHPDTDQVSSVAFSQDGSRVISGSHDQTILIWNTMTGEIQAELKGHTDEVTSVVFSQDGSRVVSGSYDDTIRIWDTMTGKVQAELKGHTGWVKSVAFSQDDSQVLSGSQDKTIRIWNTTTGEVQTELKGHTQGVTSVAFSQDGSRAVSGSYDDTIRIWNTTTGEVEAERVELGLSTALSVAFSYDGSRVVSGSWETVQIWNTVTGEVQTMDTPFVTLPDSSKVYRRGTGYFYIVYPIHPTLSLFDDHWIVGGPRHCWISSEDAQFASSSFSKDRACFGYASGRVVILDMTIPP